MMMHCTSKPLVLAGLALAAGLWLSACGSLNAGGTAPPFRDAAMSLQNAQDSIVVGKTTQAEAMAALGPATEIQFDSGYAIWVYRATATAPDADRAEFVILFAPSGVVKKTRLRPASAASTTNVPLAPVEYAQAAPKTAVNVQAHEGYRRTF